jgi:alpha-N-arabinofuranosidase
MRKSHVLALAILILAAAASQISTAQQPVTLTVRADQPGVKIDPMFYGIMTEEINFSYDGGLYAELIRNRTFRDNAQNPVNWSVAKYNGGEGSIALEDNPVPNTALTKALKLDATALKTGQRVGVANEGYWGIPVRRNTPHRVSFYAKASSGFNGRLMVAIESNDGKTVHGKANVGPITSEWKKYTATFTTAAPLCRNPSPIVGGPRGGDGPCLDEGYYGSLTNRFVISTENPGTVWFSMVSLFPPTYKNRPNGNRIDIMELLAGMKPSFLRFPGGNYLEGPNYENRFNWKETIGPIEQRPTHMSPWRYRSSDGMGLLEFLQWAEDMNAEPLLGVYAGLHIDNGARILTGDALKPHVQEALDEIEYITGSTSTTWGARRAKDGHPQPFKLRYVEIGNEDWLNMGTASYDGRFTMFYDAIKAKYPNIQIISTMRSQDIARNYQHTRKPDLLDDHFYVNIPTALRQAHLYDNYDRNATKIFVGEWATNNPRVGDTPMMAFALGDAAWLTGLERNADVAIMNAYAPLLVNVNPGGRQWAVNLIGYDALRSFPSPAYYVQKMFSNNRGDVVLPAKLDPLPMLTPEQIPVAPQPPPVAGAAARGGRGPAPVTGMFDGIYVSATRENSTGDVILKLVNIQAAPQPLRVDIQGVQSIRKDATGEMITGELGAVNTVSEPMAVIPERISIKDAGIKFSHELPAHSVSVVRLKTR